MVEVAAYLEMKAELLMGINSLFSILFSHCMLVFQPMVNKPFYSSVLLMEVGNWNFFNEVK